MEPDKTVKKFPRLSSALLAGAEEEDPVWAAQVIESAHTGKNKFSQSLVREAYRERHRRPRRYASRLVKEFIGNPTPMSKSLPIGDVA